MSVDPTSRVFAGGTKLRVLDTTWRDFVGTVNLPGFEPQAGEVEATELAPAVAGVYIKSFEAGWIDLGDLTVEGNWTEGEFAKLLAWQVARTKLYWLIQLTNGYSIGVYGWVKSLGIAAQQTDLAKLPIVIRLTEKLPVVGDTTTSVITNWGT